VLVRNTAAVGDRLLEIVDDPARGKVYFEQVWAGHVLDVTLDEVGNVKGYALEYRTLDEEDKPYTYKKVVSMSRVDHYRDDVLQRSDDLPYGFVPACWFRHADEGSKWGAAALRTIGKVDELNDLVSQAHDVLRKGLGAPVVVSTEGQLKRLGETAKRPETTDGTGWESETLNVWVTSKPAQIATIPLDPTAALEWAQRLVDEIESDHPEVTFYNQLREMGQVSGVAISQLMGDVEGYLIDAQATYDQQCIKLFQMAIAIAGWRLNSGDWQEGGQLLTQQQSAFAPFDLDSYAKGELDFTIEPRPLFRATQKEVQELRKGELEIERLELANEGERRLQTMPVETPAAVAGRIEAAARNAG
jgi:hypothetical protein